MSFHGDKEETPEARREAMADTTIPTARKSKYPSFAAAECSRLLKFRTSYSLDSAWRAVNSAGG